MDKATIMMIASGIALVSSLLSQIAVIRREFGSLTNWIFKRRDFRREQEIRLDKLEQSQREMADEQKKFIKLLSFQSEASASLLKESLKQKLDGIIIRGWIYSDEIEDVNAMYELYSGYSTSNGVHDRIERIKKLPLKERER